jgi:D-lyxose ketol-isomerase
MMFTQTHGSWGERLRTFAWDGGICTILFLRPNQRCSWHDHTSTWNQFTCIQGCIGIKTDKGYVTKLYPKQTFTVEPRVKHEFQTYDEGAVVEEIAYVRYHEQDINREALGGPLENADDE